MASLAKRPDGKWRARYRDHRGKEHSRHFGRKVDAQKWLDKVTASKVRGDYVDPKDSATLFEKYSERFMETHVISEGSSRIYKSYLNGHILPVLGSAPLGTIRRTDVQGLITSCASKGLSRNTVIGIYALTRQILQAATDDRLIPSNPCSRIKIPNGAAPEKMHIPSLEQIAIMRDSLPEYLRPLLLVLAGTGLRIGEALGLFVEDVNLKSRTVSVVRQRNQRGKIGRPKTVSSIRVIPIGETVVEVLRPLIEGRAADDWVFVDEFGSPVQYWTWQNLFTYRTKKLGYEFTTHDLRHFAASALISGGASVKQVQSFLGHSSASTTLDTYSHLWPGDEDRTRSVLDAALSGLPALSAASEALADPEQPEAAS